MQHLVATEQPWGVSLCIVFLAVTLLLVVLSAAHTHIQPLVLVGERGVRVHPVPDGGAV